MRTLLKIFAVFAALSPYMADAQQINVSTPLINTSDSFFENFGVNFGFNLRGGGNVFGLDPLGNPIRDIQFRQNSAGSAIPPFGGFDPASAANVGLGINRPGGTGLFNLTASQGSSRSIVSQVPSVTIPNGGTGTIIDTSQSPFVTGVIPVVGGGFEPTILPLAALYYPTTAQRSQRGPSPLQMAVQRINEDAERGVGPRLGAAGGHRAPSAEQRAAARSSNAGPSTAERGDLSVAQIKRQRSAEIAAEQAAEVAELEALIERARGAFAAGKSGAAKIYLRQAISRAEGDQKTDLLLMLQEFSK